MASNYTEHYGLCQWEATDQVLREEFNEGNRKVDEALADNTAAITALTVQLAAKGNCRIETFSYTGDDTYGEENPTIIPFSGKPALYVIMAYRTLLVSSYDAYYTTALLYSNTSHSTYHTVLTATWVGTQLQIVSDANAYQQLNEGNRLYQVVALYASDAEM